MFLNSWICLLCNLVIFHSSYESPLHCTSMSAQKVGSFYLLILLSEHWDRSSESHGASYLWAYKEDYDISLHRCRLLLVTWHFHMRLRSRWIFKPRWCIVFNFWHFPIIVADSLVDVGIVVAVVEIHILFYTIFIEWQKGNDPIRWRMHLVLHLDISYPSHMLL